MSMDQRSFLRRNIQPTPIVGQSTESGTSSTTSALNSSRPNPPNKRIFIAEDGISSSVAPKRRRHGRRGKGSLRDAYRQSPIPINEDPVAQQSPLPDEAPPDPSNDGVAASEAEETNPSGDWWTGTGEPADLMNHEIIGEDPGNNTAFVDYSLSQPAALESTVTPEERPIYLSDVFGPSFQLQSEAAGPSHDRHPWGEPYQGPPPGHEWPGSPQTVLSGPLPALTAGPQHNIEMQEEGTEQLLQHVSSVGRSAGVPEVIEMLSMLLSENPSDPADPQIALARERFSNAVGEAAWIFCNIAGPSHRELKRALGIE